MIDKLAGVALAAQVFINPYTGMELPPEPREAYAGCKCSVHFKDVPASTEPALPFRQGIDAPLIESVPDVLEPVK